jgi:hypothetical protein
MLRKQTFKGALCLIDSQQGPVTNFAFNGVATLKPITRKICLPAFYTYI